MVDDWIFARLKKTGKKYDPSQPRVPAGQSGGGRWAGGGAASSVEKDGPGLVADYLGAEPKYGTFKVLPKEEFNERFGQEYGELIGDTAAIRTDDGDIYVREGDEDFALHELVHAAGFMPEGAGNFLNEGMTQAAAEEIGKQGGVQVYPSYGKERQFVERYVLPATGLNRHEVFQGYAKAPHKAQYLTDLIWAKHSSKFSDEADWGKNVKKKLADSLESTMNTNMYLSYLIDELGV